LGRSAGSAAASRVIERGYSHCRGLGWEFVHVCIDDHSELPSRDQAQINRPTALVVFLKAAVAYYKASGLP